jgi:rod shape-determining protein MreC
MSKIVFFLCLSLISILYILDINGLLKEKSYILNDFKKDTFNKYEQINFNIKSFFDQSQKIKNITKENIELKKYKLLNKALKIELDTIKTHNMLNNNYTHDIKNVKVLSYVALNDFTKVWLDIDKNDSKIEGLIDNNFSAGIVINKNNQSQALLNGNKKSHYAVYVGKNKAPGITHPNTEDKSLLTIKYIPLWIKININDEVITSGMDNIFFEGLKVGKVLQIITKQDSQEAIIKPYAKVLRKRYFQLYRSTKK